MRARTSLDEWVLGGRWVASHGSWSIKGTPSLAWVPERVLGGPKKGTQHSHKTFVSVTVGLAAGNRFTTGKADRH